MFTVLVCGGRKIGNLLGPMSLEERAIRKKEYNFIYNKLGELSLDWPRLPEDKYGNWLPNVRVVTGGATGADTIAIDWAVTNWLQWKEYKPDWETHKRAAGMIRNQQMLDEENVDVVVAFRGGRGTADMVKRSKKAGIPVIEIDEIPK